MFVQCVVLEAVILIDMQASLDFVGSCVVWKRRGCCEALVSAQGIVCGELVFVQGVVFGAIVFCDKA